MKTRSLIFCAMGTMVSSLYAVDLVINDSGLEIHGNVLVKDYVGTTVTEGNLYVGGVANLNIATISGDLNLVMPTDSTLLPYINLGDNIIPETSAIAEFKRFAGIVLGRQNNVYSLGEQGYGLVVGENNSVKDGDNIVLGKNNNIAESTNYSFVVGVNNVTEANGGFVVGSNNIAKGGATIGEYNQAGEGGVALGRFAISGVEGFSPCTFAAGVGVIANTAAQVTFGMWNDVSINSALPNNAPEVILTEVGYWKPNDPLFVVGNGLGQTNRSNALVVFKSGDTKISGKLKVTKRCGDVFMGDYGRTEDRGN